MPQAWPFWKYALLFGSFAIYAVVQLRQGKDKRTLLKEVGIGTLVGLALIWLFAYLDKL